MRNRNTCWEEAVQITREMKQKVSHANHLMPRPLIKLSFIYNWLDSKPWPTISYFVCNIPLPSLVVVKILFMDRNSSCNQGVWQCLALEASGSPLCFLQKMWFFRLRQAVASNLQFLAEFEVVTTKPQSIMNLSWANDVASTSSYQCMYLCARCNCSALQFHGQSTS